MPPEETDVETTSQLSAESQVHVIWLYIFDSSQTCTYTRACAYTFTQVHTVATKLAETPITYHTGLLLSKISFQEIRMELLPPEESEVETASRYSAKSQVAWSVQLYKLHIYLHTHTVYSCSCKCNVADAEFSKEDSSVWVSCHMHK